MMASMPEVKFETSPRGVTVRSIRRQDDGRIFYRVTEATLPTLRVVPNPRVAQFARVESIAGRCRSTIPRFASTSPAG